MALSVKEQLGPSVLVCRDAEELARAAADRFCMIAAESLTRHRSFAVALAGGHTPEGLYRLLAQEPRKSRLDWRRTHIFWADERCVPPDDPASNYAMAMRAWLSRVELPSENIHRMPGELPERDQAARQYEQTLRAFFMRQGGAKARFDLILLGMGEEGHVASLFPASPALAESRRWVVPVVAAKPPAERLTLTLNVLNEAACITFLVSGGEKARILQQVLEAGDASRRSGIPAALVHPRRGKLFWLVDRAAASELHLKKKLEKP